jgi:RNA polymerase sigma-70 factor (ECF subfamily)
MTVGDFESLYQRYSRAVWATAYARRMEAEAAMDITQEAFCRLWKQAQTGEIIRHPKAWLLRVARNLAEDEAKSAFRRNGTTAPEHLSQLRARLASPLEQVLLREERALVRRWLNELPTADREILTLKYALGHSTDEIAEALEISPAAVHMRLSRARQRLGQHLLEGEEET